MPKTKKQQILFPQQPLTEKQFVEGGGCECPNCRSANMIGDTEWNADTGCVSRKVWCENCDAEFVEFYNLAGYDSLTLK